ncbi:BA14K family protein [Roseibium sp.]|uniref:BA14K family protein n=1 Tax=Roseibium sp. TaxID=1936156 RepID=UPI003A9704E9
MFKSSLKCVVGGVLAAAVIVTGLVGPASAIPAIPMPGPAAAEIPGLVSKAKTTVRFGFYLYNGHPYYSGHRGFPYRRPGWRHYNGWWFPPQAFGPTVRPRYPVARHLSRAHYDWCFRKYRSYRARDNTFQPYHGPRKACRSPYWP